MSCRGETIAEGVGKAGLEKRVEGKKLDGKFGCVKKVRSATGLNE